MTETSTYLDKCPGCGSMIAATTKNRLIQKVYNHADTCTKYKKWASH